MTWKYTFHEWTYVIALFCMFSFKRFVKQGVEIQTGVNLQKTNLQCVYASWYKLWMFWALSEVAV